MPLDDPILHHLRKIDDRLSRIDQRLEPREAEPA
jgi:hypothetical protein